MKITRTTIISLPILLLTHAAFADSEDKKKQGTAEPQAPAEEPVTQAPAPEPAPAPAPPPVSKTTTTAVLIPSEKAEAKPEPKPNPITDKLGMEPIVGMGTNHYNFGVGGRIGYTFKVPIYVGATFVWYHGDTTDADASNNFVKTETPRYYPGGELGYDVGLAHGVLMVRPYGGAGLLFHHDRLEGPNFVVTNTTNEFMIYPGLTAHINIPDSPVFIGADTRLLVPVVHANLSYQGFLVAGLKL
jgi:hypothetical protein